MNEVKGKAILGGIIGYVFIVALVMMKSRAEPTIYPEIVAMVAVALGIAFGFFVYWCINTTTDILERPKGA